MAGLVSPLRSPLRGSRSTVRIRGRNGGSTGPQYPDGVPLTGLSGSYISCPDAAPLDIAGDLTVAVLVAANDWTPGTAVSTFSKSDWYLRLQSDGTIWLVWVEAGGSTRIAASTTAIMAALSAGQIRGARAELDVDNGAGQYAVTFKTSPDGTTWNTDRTVTGATGVTTVRTNTSQLFLGARSATTENFAGKVYAAWYMSGLGGTEVASFDSGEVAGGSYTDPHGNVWTVH